MPILCKFVSGFQKCHFLCATIRNAKKSISKMWRHHLYQVLWPMHRKKLRYFFEILYACCLYASISHVFQFLDSLKISDFIGNNFWRNWNFEFWWSKFTNIKIRYIHFVERSISRTLAFCDCALLQNWTF